MLKLNIARPKSAGSPQCHHKTTQDSSQLCRSRTFRSPVHHPKTHWTLIRTYFQRSTHAQNEFSVSCLQHWWWKYKVLGYQTARLYYRRKSEFCVSGYGLSGKNSRWEWWGIWHVGKVWKNVRKLIVLIFINYIHARYSQINEGFKKYQKEIWQTT